MATFPPPKWPDLMDMLEDMGLLEGRALSVWPPANEYMIDPFWYDQAGRDPVDQASILRMDAGPNRKVKLQKIVEAYPRYGPKLFEKFAAEGRADLLRELKDLGASMDVEEAKREDEEDEDDNMEDKDRVPLVDFDIPLLLMEASVNGHLECLKFFVEEANEDINSTGQLGETALAIAAAKGNFEIVSWLLAHGARITFGTTEDLPEDIYLAMKSGNIDVVKALVDHVKSTSGTLEPSIDWVAAAAASEDLDTVTLALELNEFPAIASDDTNMAIEAPQLTAAQEDILLEQALAVAVKSASLENTRLLLSYLCARDEDHQFTPRCVSDTQAVKVFNATEDAMKKADIDTLFELVWDAIISPSADEVVANQPLTGDRDAQLNRRLVSACTHGCPRTVKLLCEKYGADINHLSHKFFLTPLARAVASGSLPFAGRFAAAQYLLQHPRIDIHLSNAKYCNGPTALTMAVDDVHTGGHAHADTTLPMVKLMLEHGGPLEDVDQDLVHHLQSLSSDTEVNIYVVVFSHLARTPVHIMLKQGYDDVKEKHPDTIAAILQLTAAETLTILTNAQIRKRDAVLAASDAKRRPLKADTDEKQGVKTQMQEQMDEADKAKLHDSSIHAMAS